MCFANDENSKGVFELEIEQVDSFGDLTVQNASECTFGDLTVEESIHTIESDGMYLFNYLYRHKIDETISNRRF